ncbi:DUF805 domain-containing protein [Commensalibacter communis]|uniref:DUF805 domain-containing protein n=1 Tax=Commensalibacter communis TaxID=2972786 RepID=UPI0022FF89AA|nr:DUF805 domain-containing protein [Commensalibacter communis]CAI3938818.1 unnamed protein product [Commensalibacter communis]CAI3939436.1 unnamed protein product [Commensalibacter communis]
MITCFFCWGIQGIQRSFDYKGRACRREVWSSFFLFLGIGIIVSLLASWMSDGAYLLLLLMMFGIFIVPVISSWVRRFHDINLSGKWFFLLLSMILSCFGYLINYFILALPRTLQAWEALENMERAEDSLWVALSILCLFCVLLIVFLALMLVRGSEKENKYGLPHDYIDRDNWSLR